MAHDQLRLRPEKRNRPSTVLDVDAPDRLLELVRDFDLPRRLEFGQRAPAVLQDLAEQLNGLGHLSGLEVERRLGRARADVELLTAERVRRQQCPECGSHRANGHLFGCTLAQAS